MVKTSFFTLLGVMVAEAAYFVYAGSWFTVVILVIFILIFGLWYWCIKKRIPMAEATLSIAAGRLDHYWSVSWIAMGFSTLNIMWCICWLLAQYGVYTVAGFIDENGDYSSRFEKNGMEYVYHLVIQFSMLVALFWGSIAMRYIVHAICAGVMGTWYFGTSRKRTVTDAVTRACTTSLGSISFAAFIVAVIEAMRALARQSEDHARQKGDSCGVFVACCVRCILECIGDILDYLNTLAIIRVAVYGEPFCVAAKRTMNMFKYRGLQQLINDDLSGPVALGCMICLALCVPVMYGCYWMFPSLPVAFSDAFLEIFDGVQFWTTDKAWTPESRRWAQAFLVSIVAGIIPMSVLGTLTAFTQTLFVLWGDDPSALDQEHPYEAKLLKDAAFRYCNYVVKYDEPDILGQRVA